MTGKPIHLKLFLDEGVPDSVGRTFAEAGHEVIYGNRSLQRGAADPIVCMTAMQADAILVAIDGDMKQIARTYGIGKNKFAGLNLIKLSCSEVDAAKRVRCAMSLIEHEWLNADPESPRRLFVEIQASAIKTYR